MADDTSRVSLKEIRETFYRLRDFEISNLWQRSIFLSALIVLFFSGYGVVASEFFRDNISRNNVVILHEICCGISLCGLAFSIIWVMMAKGSKAWYEVYERRICDIESESELQINEHYRMGADCTPHSVRNNLFSTSAGQYSVSRLNIRIGNLLMLIWIVILLIHFIAAIYAFTKSCQYFVVHIGILGIILLIGIGIIMSVRKNKWAPSGSLTSVSE